MLTLAELLECDISTLKYGTVFQVKCSRPSCEQVVDLPRHEVLERARQGSTLTYCTPKCRGQHILDQTIYVREGVAGRVCTDCGTWTPMPQMTKGRICQTCKSSRPSQRFAMVRAQARAREDTWGLSYEEFMQFWGVPCYYCGEAISAVRLDRVDPTGPYTVENVRSCCWSCNRGKGAGTETEFIRRCYRVSQCGGGA